MDLRQFFLRVYIRISSGYDMEAEALKSLNLIDLLKEVAKENPSGDTEPLYIQKTDTFFEKRTKRYIVRQTNKFIAGILDTPSDNEDMANFASLNQLNLLIRAFNEDRKRISCFALVYVYVMYSLLKRESSAAETCTQYVIVLYNLVRGYYEDHPDDEVVSFVIGCFDPIIRAIEARSQNLEASELPGRPCRHPRNLTE